MSVQLRRGKHAQMPDFERAVFEYHPENPPEWQVLLRRIGAEALARRDAAQRQEATNGH